MSTIETGSHDPRALPSGAQLSQYIIERTLGMGGFGITYLARHDVLSNKLVAIKEYMPREEAFRDQEDIIRLHTEAQRGDFDLGLENFFREAKNLFTLTQGDHPSLEIGQSSETAIGAGKKDHMFLAGIFAAQEGGPDPVD